MGAFDLVPNKVIPDPDDTEGAVAFREKWRWEAHEQVIMRGSLTAGDQETIGNGATITDKKGQMTYMGGTGKMKMLECMIVDWTFAVDGRKVEVSPRNIRRLPANYWQPLLEYCDELAVTMEEDEQMDFFGSANGHSSANSAGMKSSRKR